MISYLKSNFRGLNIPKKLVALIDFNNKASKKNSFTMGFKFYVDRDRKLLKKYSQDEEFLNSIFEFSTVSATDEDGCQYEAIYAFLLIDKKHSLDDSPIIIIGDDGGIHIIASNFDELLILLAFDSVPIVSWDYAFFYKEPDDPESPAKREYYDWLKERYVLNPIVNIDFFNR